MTLQDSYTPTLKKGEFFEPFGTRWAAGTFTAGATYDITSVKLWLTKYGTPDTGTVSITATTDDVWVEPVGADLCVGTLNCNTLPDEIYPDGPATPVHPAWTEVTFSSPATLTAGTRYAVVIKSEGTSSLDSLCVYYSSVAGLADGGSFFSTLSGTNWIGYNYDLVFETYSGETVMANMTVGSVTARNNKSRQRSVTFTHTDVATAAGSVVTTFPITGRLLKYTTVGGDAEWQFSLSDGTATIFSSGNLNGALSAVNTGLLKMHVTIPHRGIAMAGQMLTCTTANVAAAGDGTAPTITIFWEESK